MSINIGDLKYQDPNSSFIRAAIADYSWLFGYQVLNMVSSKSTVSDIGITGNILTAQNCTVAAVNTELISKEVELSYLNAIFPISDCDIRGTWLSIFANKYRDEAEVYIESLIPFLGEKISDEVRARVTADILAEATADADVIKIVVPAAIATPQNCYDAIVAFVTGFPAAFRKEAYDFDNYDYYKVEVSPEVYSKAALYLSDKVNTGFLNIGGISVVPNKDLTGNKMIARESKNNALFVNDSADMSKVSIKREPWLGKTFIIASMAFKGSYIDSKKIVISN